MSQTNFDSGSRVGVNCTYNLCSTIKSFSELRLGYSVPCFPTEWNSYLSALDAVNGSIYYVFKTELGFAWSFHFKSLVYVTNELHLCDVGKDALGRYKEWANNLARTDMMILAYLRLQR